ncbi:MAG: methylenetetrahydrofolate reductase [NAD(P)H] [Pseudomonadota bacterium]|nr:methylenetetrahydrofolate reductase [NAD(P)H] [Gammaproteobacteria bacterium]MEE2684058.1 methylenetetrahydrofolate reductase [NAD(P)H] [Pseudomonadota bacterium]|tara:strand:+ start:1332 stop:2153 length:822 start_codon:yes stop_codon:yes gene_type:complete
MTNLSFEFFPPKNDSMKEKLWSCMKELSSFSPKFVSVTYGADGSTRDRTHDVVENITKKTNLVCAPHLTCIGNDEKEISKIAIGYWDKGIRDIVALRGDLPKNFDININSNSFNYAFELVECLARLRKFNISVAAYPEVHPEAKNAKEDLDNLKRKIDAGASKAITQFFFDVDIFLRFRDKCFDAGITASIIPGILPINNFDNMVNFSKKCGTTIPKELFDMFSEKKIDEKSKKSLAISYCKRQIELLSNAGVEEFHFYTLNKSDLISKILKK